MPQAYIIGRIDITDPTEYGRYTAETARIAADFGGRFLVRGGRQEALEGPARSRQVVIAFPDWTQARAFYASADYQAILPHAAKGSTRELVLVEGVEP